MAILEQRVFLNLTHFLGGSRTAQAVVLVVYCVVTSAAKAKHQ